MRFGPSPLVLLPPLGAAACLAAFFLLTPSIGFVLAAVALVLVGIPGWNWYVLGPNGIHRVGLSGPKRVPWDEIDGVIGMRVTGGRGAGGAVFQYVVDASGRRLMTLSPWIHRRRELVRSIIMTTSERRKARAAGAR